MAGKAPISCALGTATSAALVPEFEKARIRGGGEPTVGERGGEAAGGAERGSALEAQGGAHDVLQDRGVLAQAAEAVGLPLGAEGDVDAHGEAGAAPFGPQAFLHAQQHLISVSAGISVGHAQSDAATLLRDADVAMYRAKGAGGGRAALFDSQMDARATEQLG